MFSILSGQRINLTLMDFGVWTSNTNEQPASFCDSYAVVREDSSSQQTICGGDERTRNVYVSRSNFVEIVMTRRQHEDVHQYLLKYNGKCTMEL